MQNICKWFYYDESSPSCLRWKVSVYGGRVHTTIAKHAGDVAGSVDKEGYWRVMLEGKKYLVHRIILVLHGNILDGLIGEHVNGNQSDNRICNLRVASVKQNTKNLRKSSSNTSGVAGVSWSSSRKTRYAVAFWNDLDGKRKSKYFSEKVLGTERAFQLACECRKSAIDLLNAQGAGYTERHGK